MAENSVLLTFPKNCEPINSNCVEVRTETDKKVANNDITDVAININKQEDEPNEDQSDNATQEDAVEKFLAGENKNEFNDDLLLENMESESDGIDFKSENVIMDCPDLEKSDFFEGEGQDEDDPEDEKIDIHESLSNSVEENSEVENTECLTKMQIMEDVREGCSVQPSSPGHAEERLSNDDADKVADIEENGYEEEAVIENSAEDNSKKDEPEDLTDSKMREDLDMEENGKAENNIETSNVNEESSSSEEPSNNKRKSDCQDDPNKRLRIEIQENFICRDKILNEFIELADCNTIEQLQVQTEQILAEIKTLNDLAKEKEREWNNIIHLKKMKEELLLRMQRRKQIILLNGDRNENGDILYNESQNDSLGDRLKNQSILKSNLTNASKSLRLPNNFSYDKPKPRSILPKPPPYSQDLNGSLDYRQNKQKHLLDVQSIIADYRQRHPETVPRRGRRIRNSHNDSKANNHILNFSSVALGSGAQVQHNLDINNELGVLLNAMDSNRTDSSRPSSAESSIQNITEPSFKDMLVQFAKLSQSERHELLQNVIKPPPPYPEVTVHPVPSAPTSTPTNSLLHGILTKSSSKSNSKTSFSPTLARLLTAPERGMANSPSSTPNNLNNQANMSISEILSTSKARNEITITPVASQFEPSAKGKGGAQEEEEAEDSADRLVIDESNEILDGRGRGDNSSDTGDEVPQCQGCNQKSALFVCAGCGNQWYCSRDCQVSAWDEHSEVCSG